MSRLRWLGHSTVLLELGDARLLTDPLLRTRLWHLTRRTPVPDLGGPVDVVLISHVHRDHLDNHSLSKLGGSPTIVGPRGLRGELDSDQVVELGEGESTDVAGLRVLATAAHHPAPEGVALALGAVARFRRRGWAPIYFAGDTDIYPEMAELAPLDLALLPVWGWGRSSARAT